ncbi:MAG: hypothetical protein U1C46_01800 [Bacteroidales bacterium]|nr:hypothetical protein [Bacteroidales bacterium]MDZ4203528.1 hypothetical protein [Bacteroidales bacterium]
MIERLFLNKRHSQLLGYVIGFLLLLCFPHQVLAQKNYHWWNLKHNWDGASNWTSYMLYSPGYMGPNALPVPRMLDGYLNHNINIEPGAGLHIQPGELIIDGSISLYFPFAKGSAALEINHTSIEYYKTDTLLRDERRARNLHVEGFATSDINVTSYFTLLRGSRWPDMVLRINVRTASGTRLADARHTDAPGYFFDLTFGKTLPRKDATSSHQWRFYSMLGFYAWQTGFSLYRQNDAFLFGAGSQLKVQKHTFSTELAGYLGYLQLRDDPIVLRVIYEYNLTKNSFRLKYQKGLNDIYHHSLHGSIVFFIQPGFSHKNKENKSLSLRR